MVLEKIILLNSANFNFLEIDLRKDLFFLGDNGSGKTSLIRAIHYLFSGDTQSLGIPTDKEGFKEYYFKNANSYILYTFDDFFIFMYKTGGEIVKLFSKQKFDFSHIVDEENHLFPLDRIKKYAKTPNLSVTARGVSDYRDIVYGHNKKYLDFSFIAIKNSDIFIGLFNEIFNIDKSIIDSKSIKKAIQTTLDYEKRVVDFDYEAYLQQISGFQSTYAFYHEFEKQKRNIQKAEELKNTLLALEAQFQGLCEKIAYRVACEKEMAVSLKNELVALEREIQKTDRLHTTTALRSTRWSAKIKEITDDLALEIKEIKLLKEKFNESDLLTNQNLADQYLQITEQLRQKQSSIIKLREGFEDALNSIEKEIIHLIYRRDHELPREKGNNEENQKQRLKSKANEEREKLEGLFEIQKEGINHTINELYETITALDATLEVEKEAFNTTKKERSDKEQTLRETTQIQKNHFNDLLQKLKNERAINTQESNLLRFDEEKIAKEFEVALKEKSDAKEEEEKRLEKERQKYQSMLFSKENSFKAFLNEEVDDWETVLYPLLDSELLDMSCDELHPVLLSCGSLLGFSVETTKLKHILTRTQAEEAIKKVESEKSILEESFKAIVGQLQRNYAEGKGFIETKRRGFDDANGELEKKVADSFNAIEVLDKELYAKLALLDEAFRRNENFFNTTVATHQKQKEKKNARIQTLKEEIKTARLSFERDITNLTNTLQKEMRVAENESNHWLKTQQDKINTLIDHQEEKKKSVTKDERLEALEKEEAILRIQLQGCLSARNFLDSYAIAKEKISLFHQKENKLSTLQTRTKRFNEWMEKRGELYRQKSDDLLKNKSERSVIMKEIIAGLAAFNAMKEEVAEATPLQKTDEYLVDLLKQQTTQHSDYKDKKIDLKGALEKLNQLKNHHHDLDTSFKFEAFNEAIFISEVPSIIAKIDEIVEFKEKKIETLKQSGHKAFINFVKNNLPQKIAVFSDTEDKFLSQVAKINKNLTKIDFGVIKNIKMETTIGDKKSIARLLTELAETVCNLSSLLNETSLFYDQKEVMNELEKLEKKFKEIKNELKGSAISLIDTIDLSLSFIENGTHKTHISQIKNESSTGGSILLKIAIAISILELFIISDQKTPFFLIVDEVSRLHSINQERLREFANAKGFGIIFVTPEPTYSKPDVIKYYRFTKNSEDQFEVIELNQ